MRPRRERDEIQVVDEWYLGKCNGIWEHRYGVRIETCDNPGWLVIFSDLPLSDIQRPELLKTIHDKDGAEVVIDGSEVRIFSRSLRICLSVAATLIDFGSS
jgi:hypothetical protein